MNAIPPFDRKRSIEFSRWRDARIRWLLECHPVTAAMLVGIGWFPTKAKALRRLQKLVRRKRIRLVGTVCRTSGRPENVYCRWRPKVDALLHEVELTQFCLRLHANKILRGPLLENTSLRPDAEMWIDGELFYLEWDRGTMSYSQIVRHRVSKYQKSQHLVLWVCSSAIRRDGLRERAQGIRHVALFATAAEALADPHEAVWLDFTGQSVALPRRGQKPGAEVGASCSPAGGEPATPGRT